MAESIYKVPTASVGPDGKPIFDVFEGTRKLELPEFQQRGLNIDQLQTGAAPTGFSTQFQPVALDVTNPVPMSALESTTTRTDIDRLLAENKSALEASQSRSQDLMRQTLEKVQLSPEEKAAQSRLLGLQQLQETSIQQAQERPLDGTILKAGLASEIQNIATGQTRESLVNIRKQTQEAETLNLLTKQREQELAALKLQLDQGNIDTQNLLEAQKLNEDIKNTYFDQVLTLSKNAQNTLATILDKFQGLTMDKLSPSSAAQIGILAQQSGIPLEVISQGMRVAKDQIDIQNAQEQYKNQTARVKATEAPTQPQDYSTQKQANTIAAIDDALPDIGFFTSGFAGKVSVGVPGSPAYNLQAKLDSIASNIAFGELQAMRNASKTGGALGQVSERELALLQSTLGSLDIGQSPSQLRENLEKIKASLSRWSAAVQQSGGSVDSSGEDEYSAYLKAINF